MKKITDKVKNIDIQRQMGLLFTVCGIIIALTNFINGILGFQNTIRVVLTKPAVYIPLISSCFFFFTSLFCRWIFKVLQILALLFIGGYAIIDNHTTFYGIGFMTIVLMLSYQYTFLQTRLKTKLLAIIVLTFILILISAAKSSPNGFITAIAVIFYILFYIITIVVLFRKNISEYTEKIEDNVKTISFQLYKEKELINNQYLLNQIIQKKKHALLRTNIQMQREIAKRKQIEKKLYEYQQQLKLLSSQLLDNEIKYKNTIACNLHDNIGQNLAMIKLQLEDVNEVIPAEPGEKILSVIHHISDVIQYTRSLVYQFSNRGLKHLGLNSALDSLLNQFRHEYKMKILFNSENVDLNIIHADNSELIYNAIKELLTNIKKYASATKVNIFVKKEKYNLIIIVKDNGAGFDVKKLSFLPNKEGGFGIFALQERLHNIKGRINIDSRPNKGTVVILYIPTE